MRQYRYTVDRDDLLEWVSSEWLTFAKENEAMGLVPELILGRSLWEFIGGVETRHLYRHLFEKARERHVSVSVPFRCDAPTVRRYMRLTIEPTKDASLEIVIDVLREEDREYVALLDVTVPRSTDLVTMCSWCRRVMVESDQWEEVEKAIELLGLFLQEELPSITHGVCPECYAAVMAI